MSADYRISLNLMAAGASRRFNGIKQLAVAGHDCLLQRAINAVKAIPAVQLNVVLGCHANEIIPSLTLPHHGRILIAENWHLGLGHSIAEACHAVSEEATHIMLLLGDQIDLRAQHFQSLIMCSKENRTLAICASFGDQIGVPAIFPRQYLPQLKQLTGDRGAKALLHSIPHDVISMPEAATDIDTLQQLQIWQQNDRTKNDYIRT